MVKYTVNGLERLAAHIDHLLTENATEIYILNRERNTPRVVSAIQGQEVEGLEVDFSSEDAQIDDLFYHIISPEEITGTINPGRANERECNLIWDDICRNGLGANQYERVAQRARMLILEELDKQDPSGEAAYEYLEEKVLDPNQRWRARRDWISSFKDYAHRDRLTRDPEYVEECKKWNGGQNIDVEAIKEGLPQFANARRMYSIVKIVMNYKLVELAKEGTDHDYCIRLDLVGVLAKIDIPDARKLIEERLKDPNEHNVVKVSALNKKSVWSY